MLELTPNDAEKHSNLLLTLQYCQGISLEALFDAHAAYDRQHAVALRGPAIPKTHGPEQLRLGFVSADLGRHPVGNFVVKALENLRQHSVETFCYSDRIVKDDMTRRIQSAATLWRDVHGTSDEQLAMQIREDRVDILIDLAGHTAHNRLLVFARKPAPIQITWIGYEGTTGLSAMDYLIADRQLIPTGSERYYHEKLLFLPDGYLCYEPPDVAPPVGPLPLIKNGYPTFGSFNNLAKITPQVIDVWSKILRRLKTARLMLKYRGLGDPRVKQRFLDAFAAQGIELERLDLLPPSSYGDYLATYHQVDVALDPFPFTGGATTCEALWMAVPVITYPGETFANRHSLSHLANVGLTETTATNLDEYVELAIAWASDIPRLAALRASLRERMAASPLCDGTRFAAHFVSMLQNIWADDGVSAHPTN